MNMINIDDCISKTLAKLNAESGGEAECRVIEREGGAALVVKSAGKDNGMVSVCHESADDAAAVLGLDTHLFWVWCEGEDGPTLASFESCDARELWLNQQ